MRLDGRKDIKSLKSARSILHLKYKAHVLTLLEENNKGRETNTQSDYRKRLKQWPVTNFLKIDFQIVGNVWGST